MKCELCKAVKNKEGMDIHRDFIFLICKTHNVPMIVFKKHLPFISEKQKIIVNELVQKTYPGKKLRGYMQSLKSHWHDHII